jgi:hypothetical protein
MGSPFQITLNTADVCRYIKVVATTLDVFAEDLDTIEGNFRRELGYTEGLERIVNQSRFSTSHFSRSSATYNVTAFSTLFTKVVEHWKKFENIVTACSADPTPPSAIMGLVRPSSSWKIRKRTSWALGGKEKAMKVFETVKQLNENLCQDVAYIVGHFNVAGKATKELAALKASDDARLVGITSTIVRQRIERDVSFADKTILFTPRNLRPVDQSTVSGETLTYGKFRDSALR